MTMIVIGAFVASAGLVLLVFPAPILWLNDQTNRRRAEGWAEKGHPEYLEVSDESRELLRWLIPVVAIIGGLGMILQSVFG